MKSNKKKKYAIRRKRHICAYLLIVAMLLAVTAAGCSKELPEQVGEPTAAPVEAETATPEPAAATTLEPTVKPTPKPTVAPTPTASLTPKLTATVTPTPTPMPSSGTAFTPSGTGGRVTFMGTTAEVSKAQVGDTVRFGSYEQDNDLSNGAEVIEWLVLDKQDGKLLLLSKDALDCKRYNEGWNFVTWEMCTLRSWLNEEFYHTAFSQTEQGRIATTKEKNGDNPMDRTEGGNDTEDKVFLLSIREVWNYFDQFDPARRAKVTAYAEAQGASVYDGNAWWWLRSPGDAHCAAYVNYDGRLNMIGCIVGIGDDGVRPAFWLNLES